MRIYSSYKDYYDTMASVDADPLPRFEREVEDITFPDRVGEERLGWLYFLYRHMPRLSVPRTMTLSRCIIGFCGFY